MWLECPYLGRQVELTDERWGHIRSGHRVFRPGDQSLVAECLVRPDEVRQRDVDHELLFLKELNDGLAPLCVVAIRLDDSDRWWVVTAFRSDEFNLGDVVWSSDEDSL